MSDWASRILLDKRAVWTDIPDLNPKVVSLPLDDLGL